MEEKMEGRATVEGSKERREERGGKEGGIGLA